MNGRKHIQCIIEWVKYEKLEKADIQCKKKKKLQRECKQQLPNAQSNTNTSHRGESDLLSLQFWRLNTEQERRQYYRRFLLLPLLLSLSHSGTFHLHLFDICSFLTSQFNASIIFFYLLCFAHLHLPMNFFQVLFLVFSECFH